MKYIPAEKLLAEIERHIKHYETLDRDDFKNGELYICQELLSFIVPLQQEHPDYKEAVQLVFEEELTPFKDGNQWCFLLGRNIQEGVCGFGDTILDAAVDFYKDFVNTKIHIGELKIQMAQQEQPEVDLEKEVDIWYQNEASKEFENVFYSDIEECARHFYELGLNARKEEE